MTESIPANQAQAKRYQKIRLLTSLGQTVLSFILLTLFIILGYSADLRELVGTWTSNRYLQMLLFIFILGAAGSLLSFPVSFFREYWLEHRFQMSNQTFSGFLWEKCKAMLVGILVALPVLLTFYYFLLNYPLSWWFWTACVVFIFSVILGRIAPQIIFPIFYKFERLNDEDLLQRMQRLAEKGKFALEGVYRFNMSKTTKKANAAFTGLGKSRRIIIGDTLLDNFNLDEIESVFAHEVGHFVKRHMIKGMIAGTVLSFLSLFVADAGYKKALVLLDFNGPADPAALPLLFLILSLITLFSGPVSNLLSRYHEYQADRYAADNSSSPEAFILALEKLSRMNLSDMAPHPLIEFLFYSHPSVSRRIRAVRERT